MHKGALGVSLATLQRAFLISFVLKTVTTPESALQDLATPRAQDVQPPPLSALESQGNAGAGAGNVHHFSSGGVMLD